MEALAKLDSGIDLAYETFGSSEGRPLLLIMGLGTQMIGWPDDFCRQLASRGFRVIRFDNRDCGRSTWMRGRPPGVSELITGKIKDPAYRLTDMAADAMGLLDELEIPAAHVVGVSMGGMIGQTLAIEHPERVISLTSIMSTTGERGKGRPALRILRYLVRRAPKEREPFVAYMDGVHRAISSTGIEVDHERVRAMLGRSFDRGVSSGGTGRQLGAIMASGNRTAKLRKLAVPTLVIHGSDDPLINVSGGRATAAAVPGARLIVIDGMGHDLPEGAWARILGPIAEHADAADARGSQTGDAVPLRQA